MTRPGHSDAQYLDALPAHAECTLYRLDLSIVSASIALPRGGYLLCVEEMASGYVVAKVGGAAAVPASGASAEASFHLSPGAIMTFDTEGATLHLICSAGTGVLLATKMR